MVAKGRFRAAHSGERLPMASTEVRIGSDVDPVGMDLQIVDSIDNEGNPCARGFLLTTTNVDGFAGDWHLPPIVADREVDPQELPGEMWQFPQLHDAIEAMLCALVSLDPPELPDGWDWEAFAWGGGA